MSKHTDNMVTYYQDRIKELQSEIAEVASQKRALEDQIKWNIKTINAFTESEDRLRAEVERLRTQQKHMLDGLHRKDMAYESVKKAYNIQQSRIEKLESQERLQNSENAKLKDRIQNLRAALEDCKEAFEIAGAPKSAHELCGKALAEDDKERKS